MSTIARDFLCVFAGHRFRLVQEFYKHVHRIQCDRCGGDWLVGVDAQWFAPWEDARQHFIELGFEIAPGKVTWTA